MSERRQADPHRVTIKDVARTAGVSPALVSLVLNDRPGASAESRERVRAAADALGYRPDAHATLLRRNRTRLLGVAFSVQSAFHGDLLPGLYSAAAAAGYEVALSGCTAERTEAQAIEALLDFRCDALILLGPELADARIAELGARLPVVIVGRKPAPRSVAVRTDEVAGMRLAVDHLMALGHRRITHVDGGGHKGLERLNGYLAAMEAAGLADEVEVIPGGETIEAGLAAGRTMLAIPGRRTAVIAYDDDCAWGLMSAFAESGIAVPGDLSVVGYDGGRLSRLTPLSTLSTVRQEANGMSSRAVELAVAWVESGSAAATADVVLAPSLVQGGSSAPYPSSAATRRSSIARGTVAPD